MVAAAPETSSSDSTFASVLRAEAPGPASPARNVDR
jgi:hypothetical protein